MDLYIYIYPLEYMKDNNNNNVTVKENITIHGTAGHFLKWKK